MARVTDGTWTCMLNDSARTWTTPRIIKVTIMKMMEREIKMEVKRKVKRPRGIGVIMDSTACLQDLRSILLTTHRIAWLSCFRVEAVTDAWKRLSPSWWRRRTCVRLSRILGNKGWTRECFRNKKVELFIIFWNLILAINVLLDVRSKRGTEKKEGCRTSVSRWGVVSLIPCK